MLSLNEKTILVTGAGGFIGSHLIDRLISLGAKPRAFIRYTSRPHLGYLERIASQGSGKIDILRGDLRDSQAVSHAMQGINTVFHLGALIGIPYSYVHPKETIETNINGTLNVLIAAREAGVDCIVHASSSEVYGTARYVPIDEAHPLQAQSPYSASKIGADKIAESFYDSFGLPVVVLRPFNTYGPRQSARAIIPTLISQALVDKHVRLGNLTPRRDFTYVTDTVEGFIEAAQSKAAIGQVINLGTGIDVSIAELVEKIGSILGKEIIIEQEASRIRPSDSEVEQLLSDNQKASQILGWQPEVSLEDGLSMTVEWIRKNLHLFRIGKYEI